MPPRRDNATASTEAELFFSLWTPSTKSSRDNGQCPHMESPTNQNDKWQAAQYLPAWGFATRADRSGHRTGARRRAGCDRPARGDASRRRRSERGLSSLREPPGIAIGGALGGALV